MATGPTERAVLVAKAVGRQLMDQGAQAVVLTGSHARGDAHPESDLDVRGVGDEAPKRLERHDGFLVSASTMPAEAVERAFTDPGEVGEFVPGWRDAMILLDPDQVAAGFQRRAGEWSWDQVANGERWISDQMTSQAEEIHTLVGNIDQDQITGAAAIRSQIVQGLAKLLSVRRRILYGSENDLWDLVAEEMGDPYADMQEAALGIGGVSLTESFAATFGLFASVAEEVSPLLDARQRAVVDHARNLALGRR